ncbi:MAG: hypothetical protein ACQ9MH_27620 [Nitrospinales bacterium]
MDTPNDKWAEYWRIGLKPDEEESLSLEIIKIYKELWKQQSLSSKSKTTRRRYSNGLAAIGSHIIDQLFNIYPEKYNQNKSASDVLLDFVDKYEGPLIYETENEQREIDLVSRKLYKFINRQIR